MKNIAFVVCLFALVATVATDLSAMHAAYPDPRGGKPHSYDASK